MNKVGEFYKVSFKQFKKDIKPIVDPHDTGDIEDIARELYDNILYPARATKGSAGYDFKTPFNFTLAPGESIIIPTGIRVRMKEGWMLACFPRSGLGFKYRVQLDNTVGIIDSDYFYSDNEGHIFAKLTNDSKNDKTVSLKVGDAFMQGIFIPFGTTINDAATGIRNGGLGSTSVPHVIEFAQKQAA